MGIVSKSAYVAVDTVQSAQQNCATMRIRYAPVAGLLDLGSGTKPHAAEGTITLYGLYDDEHHRSSSK